MKHQDRDGRAGRRPMKYKAAVLTCALFAACYYVPWVFAQTPTPQLVANLSNYNIKVDYYAPRDPKLMPLYQSMQKRQVLEELGQFLTPVHWSTTLRLLMKQCPTTGTPAVSYNKLEYSLIICYGLFNFLQTLDPPASFATKQEALVGGLVGEVMHSAALAAFDILQVPRLGADEDAADQLLALIAVQFGPTVAQTVIKGTYTVFDTINFKIRSSNSPYNYAIPSVAPQRAANILCIAYGSDATAFKSFVDSGLLSSARAPDCASEYQQATLAFNQTIKPHVDATIMNKALTMTWITPADLQ
jgi:Putative metallopeptidase